MKKIIKKNLKVFIGLIIGLSLGGISVMATTFLESREVSYAHIDSNVSNVQEAVEELYTLAKENIPNGHIISSNGVRYTGKNPNNYVLFNNELWRMIGIFDGKIKIIKNNSIKDISWDSGGKNDWENSSLYHYLNTSYYNGLATTYKNMVENVSWRTGGWSTANITTEQIYAYEGNTPGKGSTTVTVQGYIGILNVSDYGYASSGCYKTLKALYEYSNSLCTSTNWLFLGEKEWTLAPNSVLVDHALRVDFNGSVTDSYDVSDTFAIRPVLYLKENVYIQKGAGTSFDPYILN